MPNDRDELVVRRTLGLLGPLLKAEIRAQLGARGQVGEETMPVEQPYKSVRQVLSEEYQDMKAKGFLKMTEAEYLEVHSPRLAGEFRPAATDPRTRTTRELSP